MPQTEFGTPRPAFASTGARVLQSIPLDEIFSSGRRNAVPADLQFQPEGDPVTSEWLWSYTLTAHQGDEIADGPMDLLVTEGTRKAGRRDAGASKIPTGVSLITARAGARARF